MSDDGIKTDYSSMRLRLALCAVVVSAVFLIVIYSNRAAYIRNFPKSIRGCLVVKGEDGWYRISIPDGNKRRIAGPNYDLSTPNNSVNSFADIRLCPVDGVSGSDIRVIDLGRVNTSVSADRAGSNISNLGEFQIVQKPAMWIVVRNGRRLGYVSRKARMDDTPWALINTNRLLLLHSGPEFETKAWIYSVNILTGSVGPVIPLPAAAFLIKRNTFTGITYLLFLEGKLQIWKPGIDGFFATTSISLPVDRDSWPPINILGDTADGWVIYSTYADDVRLPLSRGGLHDRYHAFNLKTREDLLIYENGFGDKSHAEAWVPEGR